jgi:hypothetical protein
MNKTELMLLLQFETPLIPLKKVSETFFSCTKQTAKNKAKAGTLPVPCMKMGESQKAPWLVHVSDLAKHIDQLRADAEKEWVGC